MNYFNYFSEVEETFIRLRGRNLLLSPLDWALIEAWKQRGVPLHIALRAIETVFENRNNNAVRANIKSLMYCREEVEKQYKEWLDGQIGKSAAETEGSKLEVQGSKLEVQSPQVEKPETPLVEISPLAETSRYFRHIKDKLQRVETQNGFRETIAETIRELEKLEKKVSGEAINLENLEDSLTEIEQNLDKFLIERAAGEHLATINREIEKMLRPYKSRMANEIYRQTQRNLLLKRLREEVNLPRISLFYF